jgi:sulfofructose kinase
LPMNNPRTFLLPWEPPANRPYDVVGLGCAAMDVVSLLERYPAQNEKVYALEMELHGGGPVGTGLVAAARLGYKTFFAGQMGDDFAGRFILSEFEREGVEVHKNAVQTGKRSHVSICIVDKGSGDRTDISKHGELVETSPGDSRITIAKDAAILHVDGYDVEAAVEAAKQANRSSAAVVYDCGSVYNGTRELLRHTDVAMTSEKFARQMFGDVRPEEACRRLRDYGPSYTGITLGASGAVGLDGKRFFKVPAFEVEVVDTNGAGDAFHGGLNAGILMGLDFERAMIMASAVAALKCTKLGGRAGLPTTAELRRFLIERGSSVLEDKTNS